MDQQVEEISWVDQALGGDRAAFGQLMHRYAGAVYNLAYRMLGSAEDAESEYRAADENGLSYAIRIVASLNQRVHQPSSD